PYPFIRQGIETQFLYPVTIFLYSPQNTGCLPLSASRIHFTRGLGWPDYQPSTRMIPPLGNNGSLRLLPQNPPRVNHRASRKSIVVHATRVHEIRARRKLRPRRRHSS